MKMTKAALKKNIEEELSRMLHEKESLDEWFGFSDEEKFQKLWRKILKSIEAGEWASAGLDSMKVSAGKRAGKPLLAQDIAPVHHEDLAQAMAKRRLKMELDQQEQEVLAWYFEGGAEKHSAGVEAQARQKERQKAVQAAVEKEKGKRPAWKSKYAGSESGQRAADARYGVRENLKEKDKMKITKTQLRRIIKEELEALLGEEELQEDKEGKGKCPSDGCVQAREGHWVVISNKTGECWGRSKKEGGKCTQYDSREDAEGALGAYHA